ncbi:Serine/threonine protein kinase [Tsukamurella hominis]
MNRPARPADPARGRVIAVSVLVGVLIVVAAAAAATAYVSGKRPTEPAAVAAPPSGPSSSAPVTATATPEPAKPAPAPSIPGTDVLGFLGTPARCADGDGARMMVLTATSQAVVCDRAGALYYAGWRIDTGTGTRIEGVLPAGPGWVARAPDATINITPAGLVISTPSGEFTEPATGFWAAP